MTNFWYHLTLCPAFPQNTVPDDYDTAEPPSFRRAVAVKKALRKVADEKKDEVSRDFDGLFQIASNLRAHMLLTMRNCRPEEWTIPHLTRFVSLFAFLSARHTWNRNLLSMPEDQLFEVSG